MWCVVSGVDWEFIHRVLTFRALVLCQSERLNASTLISLR